ncbi:hypothetical protein EV426DRAFT_708152 [Tirmania nivea]|nr:hypothetical protein EV426DRAFT_708152 [Tirmania nivea]
MVTIGGASIAKSPINGQLLDYHSGIPDLMVQRPTNVGLRTQGTGLTNSFHGILRMSTDQQPQTQQAAICRRQQIRVKRTIITWFLAGIEKENEERGWITLGKALAEAIIATLDIGDSEADAGSSSEELSETSISETTASSSAAPPSWVQDEDNTFKKHD